MKRKKILKKLLKKAFEEIGYDYNLLTPEDKKIISEIDFIKLMKWVNKSKHKNYIKGEMK